MRTVTLNGDDITEFIITIPQITNNTGEYGQLTVVDLPNLTGDNRRGFFDVNNPASPFYHEPQLSKNIIKITDDGKTVVEASIQTMEANNEAKSANIVLKSELQRNLEKGLKYGANQDLNPATICKEICDLYEIPVNVDSISRSSAVYDSNSVITNAAFLGEGTVLDGLQVLAEVGIARIYVINNLLSFDVFRRRDVDPIVKFSDDLTDVTAERLYSNPNVTPMGKEPLEGYKVENVKHVAATLGRPSQQGKTINGDVSGEVRIKNLQSATWIGDTWVKYFNTPQNRQEFKIYSQIGNTLEINDPIQVDYHGYSTLMDIVSTDKSSKVFSVIGGQTR